MSLAQLVFLAVSMVVLGAALAVVTTRNILHSALFLALSFFAVAGLYVLLEAPFLAAAHILVYVGAISVLIIFGIMLSRRIAAKDLVQRNSQWVLALVVAVLLFAVVGYSLLQVSWPVTAAPLTGDSIAALGKAFVDPYLAPFEVASIVLVVALIGAIIIAREK
jgi:NADH-quinone oxidoreductase subunit J